MIFSHEGVEPWSSCFSNYAKLPFFNLCSLVFLQNEFVFQDFMDPKFMMLRLDVQKVLSNLDQNKKDEIVEIAAEDHFDD